MPFVEWALGVYISYIEVKNNRLFFKSLNMPPPPFPPFPPPPPQFPPDNYRHTHTCVYARVHTHTHTHTPPSLSHTHTHTHMPTHVRAHTHARTCIHTHTHTRTRTHTHTHTHTFTWGRLETVGSVRSKRQRKGESWPVTWRQSVSTSHREREIVPDGRTSGRKSTLSLTFLLSVWNVKNVMIIRGVESVWGDVQFKEVRKVWRSGASDYAVADCSNPVFCIII